MIKYSQMYWDETWDDQKKFEHACNFLWDDQIKRMLKEVKNLDITAGLYIVTKNVDCSLKAQNSKTKILVMLADDPRLTNYDPFIFMLKYLVHRNESLLFRVLPKLDIDKYYFAEANIGIPGTEYMLDMFFLAFCHNKFEIVKIFFEQYKFIIDENKLEFEKFIEQTTPSKNIMELVDQYHFALDSDKYNENIIG